MTDLEIAQGAKLEDIRVIGKKLGLSEDELVLYGKYKAKVLRKYNENSNSKLILVTAMSPTKYGEGKSTVTVGLGDALQLIGKKTAIALREPSLGPVLGIKGGACGGGYSQVVPMEDINLHFTGDFHAITSANNAIAAFIDNSIFQGNPLNIDPEKVTWHRALDMNDRALRNVQIGLGGKSSGVPRPDHFDITVASEIMAVLCLSKDMNDLRTRIDDMIVAYTYDDKPITCKDLKVTGAVLMLLKDAMIPNLVQTLEKTPAFIHGGPFANIAHGCNSVIATKTALSLADYVVTEAGFGADLGAEKFLDIKCQAANLKPSAVVIVSTIRALKLNGGMPDENLKEESLEFLEKGLPNLEKHIENIKKFNLPYIVVLNKFPTDTKKEVEFLSNYLASQNHPFSVSDAYLNGSKGLEDCAHKVVELCNKENNFKPLYVINMKIKDKIETLAKEVYGAKDVNYSEDALNVLKKIDELNLNNYFVCVAKTQYSLSDNPKLLCRPTDFTLNVRDLKICSGSKFVVVYTGKILTMPGLPSKPAGENMDVVDDKIVGLF